MVKNVGTTSRASAINASPKLTQMNNKKRHAWF